MARINLCPNPSSKNNTTDYFGGGARVTGVANTIRSTGYRNVNATSTLPRGSVVAGRTYRFSAYVKGDGGNSSGNININWYGNNAIIGSAPGQGIVVTDGQTTRGDSGAQVAPAGADQALLNITGMDSAHIVLAVLYEESSSLLAYFDGDDADADWTGTDGNSTSTTATGDSGEQPPPSGGSQDQSSSEAGIRFGWGQPIFEDNFTSGTTPNPTYYGLYNGPGHSGNGLRRPSAWSIVDGLLRCHGDEGGTTGGLAHHVSQRYGRWEVRMRAYATGGSGQQYHPVLIVWPDSDNWPDDGEYDFIENNVGDTTAGAFIHYPHPNLPVQQEHATQAGISIGDWHNYAIDWQSTGIKGYIDGQQWFSFSGGAGPGGRSNIQAMPSGHLTIQLDNFGGSPHKPANMDVEWVKVWDDQSFSTTTGVTGTGIASAENFGVPLLGNRFRMYLTNTAAPVTPAVTSSWEQTTGSVQKLLDLNRGGANTSVTVSETSTSNTFDVLAGQWVSPPMTSGGTLKGGFSWVVARNESNTAADFYGRGVLKVVSGDGTVVRGVAAEVLASSLEFTTTAQAVATTATIATPITCLPGDRLVFEVGARAQNLVNTSYSATFRYGGTVGDIESGDTGTAITTSSAWVAFADAAVEALFRGQSVSPIGITSREAFGTTTLTHPPTQDINPAGIASSAAVGTPLVKAEAYLISPSGFGGEVFGTAAVSQSIVVSGIATAEALGTPRVRRLSDIFIDAGIPTAEAFGALVLVHFQTVEPAGILSAEAFGQTQVEDPNRRLFPFSILSGEAFGTPSGLGFRTRTVSIVSAEAFGAPVVKRGVWKLVQPTRVERWRLGDPGNVIYVRNVVGLTVLGDGVTLSTIENPRTEQITAATYVWQGGHDNITEDQAIRDLWVANGYQVEMQF